MSQHVAGRSSGKIDHDRDSASFLSEDTFSSSTVSQISKSKRLVGTGVWIKWSSASDFFLVTTVCGVSTWCYGAILYNKRDPDHSPAFLHFFLVFIFIMLPLIYMQVSIGQYTQTGMVCIKELCPIIHGTAYTTLINILGHCINVAISMSTTFIYLLSCLNSNLQWLTCPEHVENCWNSKTNCSEECLIKNRASSRYFYLVSHLGDTSLTKEHSLTWIIKKFLPLASCWGLIIVLLLFIKISYRKLITILLIMAFLTFAIICIGTVLTLAGFRFTTGVLYVSWKQILSVRAWTLAFHGSFNILNVGRSLYMITGTFLAPKSHAGLLSLCCTMLSFIILVILSCLTMSANGILKSYSFTSEEAIQYTWNFSQPEIVFSIIPQSFEYLSVPQFWSFAFFLSSLLMDMNCLIVNIIIFEKCFTDANPKLQRYRLYTMLVITTIIFIASVIVYRNQSAYNNFASITLGSQYAELINTAIIIIAICVLYGVQKLCDDIHFMTGRAPTRFWKVSWYFMPIIFPVLTGLTFVHYVPLRTGDEDISQTVFICLGVSLTPIFTFAIIKILQYMKRKNLVGLFKPTELYGSTDPEERHLRRVHNPRTEIKSKRKNDACAHRCFIDNRAFRKALAEQQRETVESDEDLWRTTSDIRQ